MNAALAAAHEKPIASLTLSHPFVYNCATALARQEAVLTAQRTGNEMQTLLTKVASGERARCLIADDVSIAFGGLKALKNVSLTIPAGQVTGLIGPNGAGKTTTINALTGFYRPTSGRVLLDERDLRRVSPHRIRRLGISRTFQAGRLFKALSVLDNVAAAGVALGMSRTSASARASETLKWVGGEALKRRLASELSYTDQRRISIARAMMGEPTFLLIDEPAAGMSEGELDELAGLISQMSDDLGCGVLLIEHNMSLVMRLCSTIYLLDGGAVIESGTPGDLQKSPRLREAYLGTGLRSLMPEVSQ